MIGISLHIELNALKLFARLHVIVPEIKSEQKTQFLDFYSAFNVRANGLPPYVGLPHQRLVRNIEMDFDP